MKKKVIILIAVLAVLFSGKTNAQDLSQQNEIFWHTNTSNGITWDIRNEKRLPHDDNIEMSGSMVSGIIRYKVNANRQVDIVRDVIFPQLRNYTRSNESMYRAYLRSEYGDNILPVITMAQKKYEIGKLDSVQINGKINFYFKEKDGIQVTRSFFPSMDKRIFVEKWTLTNTSSTPKTLDIGATELSQNEAGWHGQYHRRITTDAKSHTTINPGDQYEFGIFFTATLNDESLPEKSLVVVERSRDLFLDTVSRNLKLISPDKILNTLFYFSKIRASESIFKSRLGLVHSPGGGNYYLGIWANDQAEYSGPFFGYLGYQTDAQAAMNAYRIFKQNMPKDGSKISASFELDVTFPFGENDRGDAAMIAYGASHFLLASGDKKKAQEIWPLIDWCLKYTQKRLTPDGVVASESDELEGRFPTGKANLSTSSLYYGALIQTANLAHAMGMAPALVKSYRDQASQLSKAIENYFGSKIEGLDTYKYYKENVTLRSWICLPLVVGLNTRRDATLDALFNKLWSANGVVTELKPNQSGAKVFWDRGTLYAFRGAFKAGAADQALERLTAYSKTRLTGFRVPYVVEAWPENGMAHLSAESALYCRIFTEGLLGLEPIGFNSFSLRPNLPADWDFLEITNIYAFNGIIDVRLKREKEKVRLVVVKGGKTLFSKLINNGTQATIQVN
jgi:hypothetical protein